jgi:hypothetical protein
MEAGRSLTLETRAPSHGVETHGLPLRGRPYPIGALHPDWGPVGLGLTVGHHGRTWRYRIPPTLADAIMIRALKPEPLLATRAGVMGRLQGRRA